MKYLDETGLGKLIELIKAKDTELAGSIATTDGKATRAQSAAEQAQSDATQAKNTADNAKAATDAMTAITTTEVETAWNSEV